MIVDLPQLQELSLPPTMIGRPGIEEIANILSMELLADLLISFWQERSRRGLRFLVQGKQAWT